MAGEQKWAPMARRDLDGGVDMTIEAGSRQDSSQAPDATTAGRRELARPGGRQRRTIVASVELSALARHLASRRFMTHVITGVIVVAAVAELLRENQARSVARLVAWDQKRRLDDQLASRARQRKGS
jgi:hypothetical protein